MMQNRRLARSLLALRLTVFLVMFMWALDKLVNPQHAAGIYEHFYGIYGLGAAFVRIIGTAEDVLLTIRR